MWLMEQPLVISCFGIITITILVAALVHTGRPSLLYAAILVALATVLGVVVERLVITPREEVRATLHLIARDLERNDVDAIHEHISSGRQTLRREATTILARVEILDVDIKRNLTVEVLNRNGMEIAQAKFNATVRLRTEPEIVDESRPYPQFFIVRFRREDGKWRIRDYERSDPRVGMGS